MEYVRKLLPTVYVDAIPELAAARARTHEKHVSSTTEDERPSGEHPAESEKAAA